MLQGGEAEASTFGPARSERWPNREARRVVVTVAGKGGTSIGEREADRGKVTRQDMLTW